MSYEKRQERWNKKKAGWEEAAKQRRAKHDGRQRRLEARQNRINARIEADRIRRRRKKVTR